MLLDGDAAHSADLGRGAVLDHPQGCDKQLVSAGVAFFSGFAMERAKFHPKWR